MFTRLLSWLMRPFEAYEDWRDPDWLDVYDPDTDSMKNPTPRQIQRMYGES
jgi:hypothetical protein